MNKLDTIKLDNGLTIYLYQDTRRHSTFFQFITLFGGVTNAFKFRNQEYHIHDGMAHLLEHYVVECNERGNFLEELGKRQMNTNASTHYHMTRFYFEAVEDVEFGIQTMLDGIYHVNFNQEKLDKIKKPIYQEIRGRMDNKFYHSNIMTLQNLFSEIPFRSIGGSLEDVQNVTVEDIQTCYEAFYQPKNQFIVVAGNFDKKKVLDEIEHFYQGLSKEFDEVEVLKQIEPVEVKKQKDTLLFPTPQNHVEISFKIDVSSLMPKERLDLDFYLGCFYSHFFGFTSKIYQKLVKEKVITTSIACGDNRIENFLVISISSYTDNIECFIESIFDTIKNLDDFDEEKFELDKKASILRMILRDENIMNMILPFVDNVVNFDYPYLDTVDDVKSLNFKDYVRMIQNLDFSNYTITLITEEK